MRLKQLVSNASKLITLSITSSNGAAVHLENLSIRLLNCQSICNQSDKTSDVFKAMDLDALEY